MPETGEYGKAGGPCRVVITPRQGGVVARGNKDAERQDHRDDLDNQDPRRLLGWALGHETFCVHAHDGERCEAAMKLETDDGEYKDENSET